MTRELVTVDSAGLVRYDDEQVALIKRTIAKRHNRRRVEPVPELLQAHPP